MKLNFIQNLSDEVIRENHHLKNELVHLNQRINAYQQQMVDMITQIAPNKHVYTSPEEILKEFIREIKVELGEYATLKSKCEKITRQLHELDQKNESAIQQLLNRDNQNLEHSKKLEFQRESLSFKIERLQEDLGIIQVTHDSVLAEMQELKKEKLKLEEVKRNEVETIRQEYHNEMLKRKSKSEQDYLKLERDLRVELDKKDKTIKQMATSLEKLKNNLKLDERDGSILDQMFRSFQEYNDLAKTVQDLRTEHLELREEKKELFNANMTLQCKLRECKAVQYNLMSMNERLTIEKMDLDKKLQQKIMEIHKSEKDKEAMESYYDQRWNNQYKKVKHKLEKNYGLKIIELQQQFKRKVAQIEINVKEANQKREVAEEKAYQIELIFQKDKKQKQKLNKQIQNLQNKLIFRDQIQRETWSMTREEVNSTRFELGDIIHHLKYKNDNLTKELEKEQEKQIEEHLAHCRKIEELQTEADFKLQQKIKEFECDKSERSEFHQREVNKLKQEVVNKLEMAHNYRLDLQKKFKIDLKYKQQQFQAKLQVKQEQNQKRNDKWLHKYSEMEGLMVQLRKKNEDDWQTQRKEVKYFQSEVNKLKDIQAKNYIEIKELLVTNEVYLLKIRHLQEHMKEKCQIIVKRQKKIEELEVEAEMHRLNIKTLQDNRSIWKGELMKVETQYKLAFEELRNSCNEEISLYRTKIRQLEDLNKRKFINRKDFEQMQAIASERKELKSELHIKEAQNIILCQVKDYYQTKLKQTEQKMGAGDFRNTHSILARKLKRNRMTTNGSELGQRVFQPKEIQQKKRYLGGMAINSTRRHYNLSLSKSKFEESHKVIRLPSAF